MLLVTISELSIYIILFRFMYLHDNNERLRRLLEPNVIRQRNKTNAITFFGQFCSFLFEISVWILFMFAMLIGGKSSVGLLAAFSILKTISFTCMTVIEVMTSSSLRSKMHKHFLRLHIFKKWRSQTVAITILSTIMYCTIYKYLCIREFYIFILHQFPKCTVVTISMKINYFDTYIDVFRHIISTISW